DVVAPSTAGYEFFAGGEKGRAHCRRVLPTTTAAIALLKVADEGSIFEGEGEPGRELQIDGSGKIFAQTGINLKTASAENLSRIHPVPRIENAFDLAHRSKQFVAQLFAHVFRARDPDAVLGRERTFELFHQRRGLVRDLVKLFQIFAAMKIE